ncbi:dynein axonemal intermediate chain 1-like [Panulirus ornatus]|uniref:dynein axonemal intermediate chain 1-like n=1 Tax=Panulirus ornatus TaxID=150431 RepID=UPI003A85095D
MWKSALTKIRAPAPALLQCAEQTLKKTTQPVLIRLRMLVRLSRILGKDVPAAKGRPRVIDTRARPAKGRQVRIFRKMRTALGKSSKPRKLKKPKSVLWAKVQGQTPIRPSWDLLVPDVIESETEPEVQIQLTTTVERPRTDQVIYNFTSGYYEEVVEENPLLDLLTLPSKVVLKDEVRQEPGNRTTRADSEDSDLEDVIDDSRREMEELYGDVVSKEELARIDKQPNPFNFSDRVSRTTYIITKEFIMQTDPPPSTKFAVNVGQEEIYSAYMEDQKIQQQQQREMEDKDRDRGIKKPVLDPIVLTGPEETTLFGYYCYLNLVSLRQAAKVLERMVTQNIYDDIAQDFKFWEDGSDEYHPLQGSLLPLWKFRTEESPSFMVADVCWSPINPDLFAAAYTTGDAGEPESVGMLCIYSLKNPDTPERVFHAPGGIITLHFHPQRSCLLAAGWSDGSVALYDVTSTHSTSIIHSTTVNGKHLLPVTQVRWLHTPPEEDLTFFSVSLDGRVTQWHLRDSCRLTSSDILDLGISDKSSKTSSTADRVTLEGVATSIAFRPDNECVLLLGVDTGAVFQCSTVFLKHSVFRYPAHTSPVRGVAWNIHHHKTFVSCSLDWTIKVWLQHSSTPLITLNLGGGVAGVTWSPHSSSVLVAVTDECRVHVYDLFLRRCSPMCIQNVSQRRRMVASCIAFSPFYPIIIIGGNKGHLASFKLSPNLRKVQREAKDADANKLRELELNKMERLIAINRG